MNTKIIKYRKNGKWYQFKEGDKLPDTIEAVVMSERITLEEFETLYPGINLFAHPMVDDTDMPKTMKEIQFWTLLELVKEHRKNCDSSCNISLYPMKNVAENLIGRELTQEEFRLFI